MLAKTTGRHALELPLRAFFRRVKKPQTARHGK
jgi:hypothetical protein